MSTEAKTVAEVIQITEERFKQIAPEWMKYESEKGFAIQLLKNNSYLEQAAKSSPTSLQQAITNVAAIGLSLNPAEKLAYLIPRNIKVKTPDGREQWEQRVYLEPSYMGLIRLATDSGSIDWIQAKIVRANDQFMDSGVGEKPTHTYNAFTDRGEVVGAYAVAKTIKGDYLTSLLDINQLNTIRDRSETYKKYKSGTWVTDFEEMAKKAVIRNLFKTLPRTDERRMAILAQAVHLSNENEGFEPLVSEPKYGQPSAEQKNHLDYLIEHGDALGMYLFAQSFGNDASSPEASIWVSLTHSFPKGQKGKYGDIINELRSKGENQFNDLLIALTDAISAGDDIAIGEAVEGLDNDAIHALCRKLNAEQEQYFNEVRQ